MKLSRSAIAGLALLIIAALVAMGVLSGGVGALFRSPPAIAFYHWKTTYDPGDEVPVSGIYICVGCNREITSNKDDPFPPQNHHQHSPAQGRIRWKLNVRTNTTGAL